MKDCSRDLRELSRSVQRPAEGIREKAGKRIRINIFSFCKIPVTGTHLQTTYHKSGIQLAAHKKEPRKNPGLFEQTCIRLIVANSHFYPPVLSTASSGFVVGNWFIRTETVGSHPAFSDTFAAR